MALTDAEAKEIATDILRRLCGNRWTFPVRRAVDVYPMPSSRRLFLTGRPVRQIYTVTTLGKVPASLSSLDWTLYNGFQLEISKHAKLYYDICDETEIEIDYEWGLDVLPKLLENAIAVYSAEILLAANGSNECRLPERVTNVTRNGMSWTLLDPQDFLADGRTGIYEVDLALRAYNPSKAKARARVFTSANPPAKRRTVL